MKTFAVVLLASVFTLVPVVVRGEAPEVIPFCTKTGTIDRVVVSVAPDTATITLRESPSTDFRWTATILAPSILSAATNALASRTRVSVTTLNALCLGTGPERPIGTVLAITVSP